MNFTTLLRDVMSPHEESFPVLKFCVNLEIFVFKVTTMLIVLIIFQTRSLQFLLIAQAIS